MKTMERRYPIGIQTFSEIIRGGYAYVDKTAFDIMDENPLPLLYQSGYLTIKDYDPEFGMFILGFPIWFRCVDGWKVV